MKKELLLASLLASNVVAQMTVAESKALASGVSIANLANKGVYQSAKFMLEGKEVVLRITLAYPGIKGQDYTYDGLGGLDAEMFFEIIDTDTYEALDYFSGDDNHFFIKKSGQTSYNMFDCSSTSNCYDENTEAFNISKDANGWKIMEFKSENYMGRIFRDLGISEDVAKAANLNVLKEF